MPLGGIVTTAAVGQTLLGGAKAINGFTDEARAEREQRNLKDPFYKIQNEYFKNRDIAANLAESGLPTATKNYVTTEAQRGLTGGIDATLQGGGDVDNIAKLYSSYGRTVSSLAAQDATMRLQNVDNFIARNKDLAGQKTMQWAINEYQPYERKLNELKQRMAADKQNEFGGISDALSGLSAVGTSLQNANLSKSFSTGASPTIPIPTSINQTTPAPQPLGLPQVNGDMSKLENDKLATIADKYKNYTVTANDLPDYRAIVGGSNYNWN